MFCIHCGKKIDDDNKFCPYCGGSMPGGINTPSNRKGVLTSDRSNKSVIIGVTAGLVAVLAVIGIVKIFTSGSDKSAAERDTEKPVTKMENVVTETDDEDINAKLKKQLDEVKESDNKFGDTLPEKLFKMSAEEYATMTRTSFKNMLDEEGVLYTQTEYYAPATVIATAPPAVEEGSTEDFTYTAPVIPDFLTRRVDTPFRDSMRTTIVDSFMGYDCIYGCGNTDLGTGDCVDFILAFETQEDFKEFKSDIEKYLNQNLTKGAKVLEQGVDDLAVYLYSVDRSDECVGDYFDNPLVMENWKATLLDYYISDIDSDSADELVVKCAEYLDSGKELDKQSMQEIAGELGYEIYKFVMISYVQIPDAEDIHDMFSNDKEYTNMCMIQVFCSPMTEEQYNLMEN